MSKTTSILALIGTLLLVTVLFAGSLLPRPWLWPMGIAGIALAIPELIASRKKIAAALDKWALFGEGR